MEGRQAGDARFAQFLDALHDQSVVGARGAEAEGRAGHRVLDLGGQRGQAGQHAAFVLGAARLADTVHQFGQPGFRLVEPAADLLGNRQAEQRHHPVGLDLDQALDGAPGLALRHATR